MTALSITILTFGIMSSIYAAKIPCGQQIQSLLLTRTNQVLSPSEANPLLTLNCPSPWVLIGTRCVFVDISKATTFDEGRNFCRELHEGADLATFRDANEFHYILQHIKAINSADKNINFWIGGKDEQKNNIWTWVDGQPMPMGSPFWGVWSGAYQPTAKNHEYCACLARDNRYFVHDAVCTRPYAPVCQYDPFVY